MNGYSGLGYFLLMKMGEYSDYILGDGNASITRLFISKYREKVLHGQLKNDVREIIKILCRYQDIEIIDGAVCPDHIHLSVAINSYFIIAGL